MRSNRSWMSNDEAALYEVDVQALSVRHVIGFNRDNTSTPLVFVSDGVVAYLVGCFVTLFDLRTNCQVQHLSLESRKRLLSCLAISDDANILAAGETGQDPSVLVWLLDQCPVSRPFELRGHKDSITTMAFSPNATVGNTQDSQLFVWDCQTETALCSQLISIQANLTSLSFSSDSKALYTSGKSHFTMWNLVDKAVRTGPGVAPLGLVPKPAMPSSEKSVEVVDVKASRAGKSSFIFAVTRNGILYKLRQHKGGLSIEKKIDLRVSNVTSLAVGVNKLAVSLSNGSIKMIRSKTMAVETTIAKPALTEGTSPASVSSAALYCTFDGDSSASLAAVYGDGSVCFWDAEDSSRIRCYHAMHSPSGCITDIFSLLTPPSDQKTLDQNLVKAMRSPHIHNPQAVESEFATCSDKGIISLWNLKMQRAQPRQHVLISPASQRPGPSPNPRVEIEVQTFDVNPPPPEASKPKAVARRTKSVMGATMAKKDTKRTSKSKAPTPAATKSKKVVSKSMGAGPSAASTSKRAVPKKTAVGAKSTGKPMVGASRRFGMSTELSDSVVLSPPVVAVPKAGPSRSAANDFEGSPSGRGEDAHLTCIKTSPDGMHLVVGDNKGVLRIYQIIFLKNHSPSLKMIRKKSIHASAITTVEFSLLGSKGEVLVATGAQDGSVSVMEVHNDFQIKLEKDDHEDSITGLSFSPDGQAIVSCGRDNYLYYDSLHPADPAGCDEEDIELFLSRHLLMTSTFEAMYFNKKQGTYMLACSDNFIRMFNLSGQFVHTIQIPRELGVAKKILQGPIPQMIITCHANDKVGIFEYFTGKLVAVADGHSKLNGALLINNGRNLVTTGDDGVMVIWELNDALCRRCMTLPKEMNLPQAESAYTTDLYYQIQQEKRRRDAKAESVLSCSEERNLGRCPLESVPSFDPYPFSEASTPVRTRPETRLSGAGLPMVSPVEQSTHPLQRPPKEHRLPSWLQKADQMSDNGFLDGFDSVSPSIYSRPPRLDLVLLSDTDDEFGKLPMKLKRSISPLNSRFRNLDSIPDHFSVGPGFSRRGLGFENDRFNRPADSMKRGRLSKDSFSGSPPLGAFHPCSSLAQYHDGPFEGMYRQFSESPEMGFARPTGPEPPSSVSCTTDSRTSTPFGAHPTSCFDPDAMLASMAPGECYDDLPMRARSPFSGGPIGPNIHRIATRTPQSFHSDQGKTLSPRNSDVSKIYPDLHSISASTFSPMESPQRIEQKTVFWNQQFGDTDDEIVASLSDRECDGTVRFECPLEEQPDTPIARAGGRMSKNPLYSSGSEASDLAYGATKRMAASIGSAKELSNFEKEASFVSLLDSASLELPEQVDRSDSPLRSSVDLLRKAMKTSIFQSLDKLKADIGLHSILGDCQMSTSRKQQYVEDAQHELAAFLEKFQG